MNRPSQDEYFMDMAFLVRKRSNCLSRGVGCVLVDKKNRVLATGYNGVPRGFPHCTKETCPRIASESGKDLGKCLAVHAEQNALIFCSDPDKVHKAYITTAPCMICTVMLLNTACEEIIYQEEYGDMYDTVRVWTAQRLIYKWLPNSKTLIRNEIGVGTSEGSTELKECKVNRIRY